MGWILEAWNAHEKVRFLVVGAYNSLFGFVAFLGLYALLSNKIHYAVILVFAHLLAVCNAFIGHRCLTFRVQGQLLADFLRFNISYLGVLAIGLVLMPLMVETLRWHPLESNATLILITSISSFVLHKWVSFRR